MPRRSTGLVIGLGLASTLLLAACGSSSGGSKATGNSSKATTATKTASAATSNAPGIVAGQDELNLPFNSVVFDTTGKGGSAPTASTFTGYGFDSGGNTLSASGVPTGQLPAVTIGGTQVHFWVPPLGSGHKSALQLIEGMQPESATVQVQKPGPYKSIALLEGAGNGPLTVQVTPTYSDGTKGSPVTVQIDDWCTLAVGGTPAPGAVQVLQAPNRLSPTGTVTTPACGMEGITANINPSGKTITAITFGNVHRVPKSNSATQSTGTGRVNITAATLLP